MTLDQEIQALKKEVADLREALHLIENPPGRYGPRPGEIPILDFLKLELQSQKSDQERQKLLELSNQALNDAQSRLAAKEKELEQLEADCQAITSEIGAAGEAVVAAEVAYRESLEKFKALAQKHEPLWRKLHPNEELYRQMSSVSFPAFVMFRNCGTLTTDAIARDLKSA
jgi:DNA repair exonuclease SbcCD ATPase subunit